jgi:hypothetical protein
LLAFGPRLTTPRGNVPERKIGKRASGYEASFPVLGRNPLDGFDAAVRDIRRRVNGRARERKGA